MHSSTLRVQNLLVPLAAVGVLFLAWWMILNIETKPILIFAAFYAMAFWTLAWHRPDLAMALVFSIAPFQHDLGRGGLRFSLTEVHIALLLPVVILRNLQRGRAIHVGPTLIPVLLYFTVCVYTSIYNNLGRSTWISIIQMAIYLLVVVALFASYPDNVEQFRPALYGLILVGVGIACYSLALRNNFFLGLGKNGVGQSLSCVLLIALELWFASDNPKHKKWLAIALAICSAGLVFSVSRGAWLGAFTGAMLICVLRRQYKLMFRSSLMIIPFIIIAWQFLPDETKQYATSFDPKRVNIAARYEFIETAKSLFYASPIYGSGVGLRKQYDATNMMWSTLAETGVLGLMALVAIHIAFFWTVVKTHKYLVRNTLHYSLVLIGGALVMRHMTHGMVDHYWSRGAVTIAWAGAGMVAYCYFVVQREMRRRRHEATSRRLIDVPTSAHRSGVPRLPSSGWSGTHPA